MPDHIAFTLLLLSGCFYILFETEKTDRQILTFVILVSIGIAHLEGRVPDLDSLLNRADRALYEAKHLGRNRSVVDDL